MAMNKKSSAAARILENVVNALTGIEDNGLSLDDFLDKNLDCPDLRRTVSNLLFTHFRRRRELEAILSSLVSRPPKPFLRRVLLAVMTQIYFSTGIVPESAVNVAVDWVRSKKSRQEAGFVNAVLRKAAALSPEFSSEPEKVLPPALLKIWKRRFSCEELQDLTTAFLTPAENTFRCRRGQELSSAEEKELNAIPLPAVTDSALWKYYALASPENILNHPAWQSGRFYFQDPATSGAMSLPDYSKVKSVLDTCAAPGGKSLMAAEMLGEDGKLIAADRSEARQRLTAENFRRCGYAHRVITASPWEYPENFGVFDLVIADVPCSNTGVFRRRPDALWRYRQSELNSLQTLQKKILECAAKYVASGGQLLYSTCSIEPSENEELIADFLSKHTNFRFEKEIKLLPRSNHDGAYGALLIPIRSHS